jgi:hypothetical protein
MAQGYLQNIKANAEIKMKKKINLKGEEEQHMEQIC